MIVNYLLILIVLLLFAGLGVDAGVLEWRYLQLSSAVRASAIAGSLALQRGGSSTLIKSAALNAASLNGFTNNSNGVTVTVQNPPAAGPYSGKSGAVRSTITQSVGTSFMGLAGFPRVSMTAYYDHPGTTVVSMTSAFNVNAICRDTTTVTNGGFDTTSYAYSATTLDSVRTANNLGPLLSWRGNLFFLGAPDSLNGASEVAVSLPQSSYSQLLILAGTAYGPLSNIPFVVNYTDGSTATTYFNMSDWVIFAGYPNEALVQDGAYRLYSNQGADGRQTYVFGYTINLTNTKTVKSLTLPNYRNVVVLAMDLVP